MSQKDDACDAALLRAIIENPEVKAAADRMMRATEEFESQLLARVEGQVLESEIPRPGDAQWDQIDSSTMAQWAKRWAHHLKDEEFWANKYVKILFDSRAYQIPKQMRVALMLSNPLTHIKNFVANAGQATVVRPLEEGMSVLFSQRRGPDAQRMREMWHYAAGMGRAAQDSFSVLQTLGKIGAKKGAFAAEDIKLALREAGYSEELAMMSKTDLVDVQVKAGDMSWQEQPIRSGLKYILNGMFGTQFSALSGMDIAFKMVSHRAKVQQLLSRQAVREGKAVDKLSWDRYVAEHWDDMSAKVKEGKPLNDDIEFTGIAQAAEDTFTETPSTGLGRLAAGKSFPTHIGFARAFVEGMQIVAPFRSIYVNLMRQAIPRRLMPWFSKQTMAELSGKMGPEMQDLARARFAASWTLFAGTAGLVTAGGIKIHGADDPNPAIRDLQFATEGKVGNTLQIGDYYYPLDALPPSLAIPLSHTAAALEGYDEIVNFKYSADDDALDAFMAGISPFMRAATDGVWMKEYLGVMTKTNSYIQYGNFEGLTEYFASLTTSPAKPPRWIQDVFGVSPDVKTTDGAWNKIQTDWFDRKSAYGYRRNMFGRRITPPERIGNNLDKPYFGGDDEIINFLNAIEYDRVYPDNVSLKIGGMGNGKNGVPEGADDVAMTPQAIDRFEYYTGQSRMGNGMTFEEELKSVLTSNRLYDDNGNLRIPKVKLQKHVNEIHARRRQIARVLVQYNPAFGIREKQINAFHDSYVKNGGNPRDAAEIKRKMITDMNLQVQKLRDMNAF